MLIHWMQHNSGKRRNFMPENNTRQNTKKRGFTLIELLIVIAIIALLAAILFPVFGRARENARRASCSSNLRQIGLAMQQYATDYDSFYPAVLQCQAALVSGNCPSGVRDLAWPTLIYPYIKSQQVYVCPSNEKSGYIHNNGVAARTYYGVTSNDGSTNVATMTEKATLLSYSRNVIPTNGWKSYSTSAGKSGYAIGGTRTPIRESALRDSSGTIHIVDGWSSSLSGGASMRGITSEIRTDRYAHNSASQTINGVNSTSGDTVASKVAFRHFQGFNALFGDGHVKWLKSGSTTPSQWTIQED